jgi:type I restriction enzyme S subunit
LTATGGAWGSEPEEGDVVARCIRGTDFDYVRLRTVPDRAPTRGYKVDEFRRRAARRGDLIIEKSGGGEQQPVGRVVLHGMDELVVPTNFAGRLRPADGIDARFLCYLMASLYSGGRTRAAVKQTTGIQNLDLDALLNEPVRVPDQRDQQAVSDFLDSETARIDALISKKRRMVYLVQARFSSYIRRRLAAIGPVLPLKRRWTVVDCKHRTPTYVDDGYPVVSPGDVTPGRLDLSRAHRFVDEDDFADLADPLRRPMPGDIIYSRNASIGIAAYVDTDRAFCMGQDVCLITSNGQDQLYLSYVLNSVGLDQLELQKIGSTFNRVNIAQIVELLIPTPAVEVQRALAREFDRQRETVDTVIDQLRRQVALLQEHRQALITAAVTGELAVPGVAA